MSVTDAERAFVEHACGMVLHTAFNPEEGEEWTCSLFRGHLGEHLDEMDDAGGQMPFSLMIRWPVGKQPESAVDSD